MKYKLYAGETTILAFDDPSTSHYSIPDWLWQYGGLIVEGQLYLVDDDLELMVDGRRAWRQKLPEGAIERRESPRQGCCRG